MGGGFLSALAMIACTSAPLPSRPPPSSVVVPGYTLLGDYLLKPTRKVDLAFVLDDSPSMGPKRDKLRDQLPSMLEALANPNAGNSLPSLRVAILDGDLGSGGTLTEGACAGKNGSILGDGGAWQMIDGPACGMTDLAALWMQTPTLSPANYSGDMGQVLACLACGVGQSGCGYQQPLQALSVSATSSGPAYLPAFLREDAFLGIVIVSDQDDCSALPNATMFGPVLPGETANLRCATRGHACGGQNLPYPTTAGFTAPFSDCSARMDTTCDAGTDFSGPTACTPLADVHALAEKVKALKPGSANDTILVAGIFGWPQSDAQMASATYKIAPIPNPAHAQDAQAPSTVYDLWPVCYDPDHPPAQPDPATGYDATAASFGAKPGLRLSAFIDEFGRNGLKFSMCQPDWGNAFKVLGETPYLMHNICIDQKFVDVDPSIATLDPNCIVDYLFPTRDGLVPPACLDSLATPPCFALPGDDRDLTKTSVPRCDDNASTLPCWKIVDDTTKCPDSIHLLNILRTPEPYTPAGAQFRVQCRFCPTVKPGVQAGPGCDY
jgi:hypothetical protein